MTTPDLKIRRAGRRDAGMLARLGRQSFEEAFGDHPKNDPADLRMYMESAFSVETIDAELTDPSNVYFVAEIGGSAVGYAKLVLGATEDGIGGVNPIELSRLYSLGAYIGKGIGRTLMNHCKEFTKANGHDVLWLGVWEYNHRAQEFYKKAGFSKCGEHIFVLGTDPQTDWLMEIRIN